MKTDMNECGVLVLQWNTKLTKIIHSLPSWESYNMYFVSIFEKNYHIRKMSQRIFFVLETVMLSIPDGQEGDKAILKSPSISVTEPTEFCVRFRYMLYGTGTGTLSLAKRNDNGTAMLLWEVCGHS